MERLFWERRRALAEGVPGSEGMEEPAVDRFSIGPPEAGEAVGRAPEGRAEEAVLQLPVAEVAAEESGEHHLRIVVGKITGKGVTRRGRAGAAASGRGRGAAVEKLCPMLLSRTRAVAEEVGPAPERGHGGAEEVGSVLVAGLHVVVPKEGGEIVEGHRSVIRSQE